MTTRVQAQRKHFRTSVASSRIRWRKPRYHEWKPLSHHARVDDAGKNSGTGALHTSEGPRAASNLALNVSAGYLSGKYPASFTSAWPSGLSTQSMYSFVAPDGCSRR